MSLIVSYTTTVSGVYLVDLFFVDSLYPQLFFGMFLHFLLAGDICSLSKRPGPCMGYFPRWFYNTFKGKCQHFIFGGCRSNANNFHSKSVCEENCSGKLKKKKKGDGNMLM